MEAKRKECSRVCYFQEIKLVETPKQEEKRKVRGRARQVWKRGEVMGGLGKAMMGDCD